MDTLAHGLLGAAAAVAANRSPKLKLSTGWTVWWAISPDVIAFGPMIAAGLWMRLINGPATDGRPLPHVHLGIPLYPAVHSLLTFFAVFAIAAFLMRRIPYAMLGWLLHIVIDIPTHSLDYYALRFLWPVSDFRIDGIAWWRPWFWTATYAALALIYFLLWKKRWLRRAQAAPAEPLEVHK